MYYRDDKMIDQRGWFVGVRTYGVDVEGMMSPVRCLRCYRGVYDLGAVEVTARYTDCSVWRTPCCRVTVDSRGAQGGWGVRADYEHISQRDCVEDE